MPIGETTENLATEGVVVYEVGLHLVPTISEEDVAAKFGDVRAEIEERGGSIVSEGFPVLTTLAYTIVAKGGKFDRAYFGWIKFELSAAKIASFKEACDTNPAIIRFLITKTTKEVDVEFKKPLVRLVTETETTDTDEVKAVVSEEELDKSLEGIVA